MITSSGRTRPPTSSTSNDGGRSQLELEDELTVVAWRDPLDGGLEGLVATASDEALVWYTPSVGTIGMVMAHRLAQYAASGPSTWTVSDMARTFGIAASTASRLQHTFERLERFGIVRRDGTTIAVRLWLPPLTFRQRLAMPGYLAVAYWQRDR